MNYFYFATTLVVVSVRQKTSYHLSISPSPTNLPNTLKIHTGENKIDRQGRQYSIQLYMLFPANGSTNPDVFSLKHSASHGESSLKISARWVSPFRRSQGTNKQTNKQTHTQTHSLTDWRFYRVIAQNQLTLHGIFFR